MFYLQAPTANVMPSLTVQLARQHFTHPIHVLPARSGATAATALRATYQGVRTPLACDLHLVNLRSLGVAPRGGGHRAALLLHRLVFDCAYPKPAVNCQLNKGEVRERWEGRHTGRGRPAGAGQAFRGLLH